MEGLSTKTSQIVTAVKSETRGRYDTGEGGAQETWYVSPHASAKGVSNKGRGYTSTYTPGTDHNKISEIQWVNTHGNVEFRIDQ